MFLENSISFNYKSELTLFAFLLPMEYIFEDFIYEFIEKEIEGINPKGQVSGTYLDEEKKFGLKLDLILDLGYKKVIADTKYKLIYTDDLDPKNGFSQKDIYQMLAYAVRFSIQEIVMFYPNTIFSHELKNSELIITDKLADEKEINIKVYQLQILDKELTIDKIRENKALIDSFDSLKNQLKDKLISILT